MRRSRPAFELDELTIDDLSRAMQTGKYTARRITELYLARIEANNRRGPMLRAVIEINPDALAMAAALDVERKSGRVRGPMHGIPVLVKANIAQRIALTPPPDRWRSRIGFLRRTLLSFNACGPLEQCSSVKPI